MTNELIGSPGIDDIQRSLSRWRRALVVVACQLVLLAGWTGYTIVDHATIITYGQEGLRDSEEHVAFLSHLARRTASKGDVDAVQNEMYPGDAPKLVSVEVDGTGRYSSSVCGSSSTKRRLVK